jgi:cytochrome bd-type quinol oxidase subunit 2
VSTFVAKISPPILAFALPALVVCAVCAARRRPASHSSADSGVAVLALAWSIGTWLPFELQNLVYNRISWIYYMLVVLPGVYIAVAYLASLLWRRRSTWLRGAVALWGLTVLAAGVGMFPFVAIF